MYKTGQKLLIKINLKNQQEGSTGKTLTRYSIGWHTERNSRHPNNFDLSVILLCSSRNARSQCRLSAAVCCCTGHPENACAALPRRAAVGWVVGPSWLRAARPRDLQQGVRVSQEAICDTLFLYTCCFLLAYWANEIWCLLEWPFHFNGARDAKEHFRAGFCL